MNERIWHNTVPRRHVANVLGIDLSDVEDAANALSIKTLNGRYERYEVRQIIAKLIVRTNNPERLERLHQGMADFADEPD